MPDHGHPHDESHSHEHDHPHDGSHSHDHSTVDREQAQLGPSDAGMVVMDIGGSIGSIMILTGPELLLAEIEVSLVGHDDTRTHIAIRERRSPNGSMYAGVFPGLEQGDYTVWNVDGSKDRTVTVVGGEIAEVDWRNRA